MLFAGNLRGDGGDGGDGGGGWGVMWRMQNPSPNGKVPAVGPGLIASFAPNKRTLARVGVVLLSLVLRELLRWLFNVMRN